jgi:cytochrome c oxidase subunit 2
MNRSDRRRLVLGGLAVGIAPWWLSAARAQKAEPRVIELVAQRFRFEPAEVPLKVGEHVIIAIRSLDFIHGMNIPELGLRADLLPSQVTRIELQPKKAGVIDFLCDNFCGDGHEGMHGRFVVRP